MTMASQPQLMQTLGHASADENISAGTTQGGVCASDENEMSARASKRDRDQSENDDETRRTRPKSLTDAAALSAAANWERASTQPQVCQPIQLYPCARIMHMIAILASSYVQWLKMDLWSSLW